jgi:hypothetical protein
MDTFPNEMIHITHGCDVHLHGHQNNVMPLMKSSILANFSNDAKFRHYTHWLTMTLEAIVFLVKLVTTTLAIKTWSSQVM